ncbi:MAG: crossover junction endodeoxyribonuclease RuvC [Christensenellales bacterium]
MIIIGIDPGLAIMGYGVIEYDGNRLKHIDHGCIYTESDTPMPTRLRQLYDGVFSLVKTYNPASVAVEELFFSKNVKTAIAVGHARGMALLAAEQNGCVLYEYTPKQVKQAVVGYGGADKTQVQQMIKVLLNLKEIPKPDDAADALAIAVCQAHTSRLRHGFRIK